MKESNCLSLQEQLAVGRHIPVSRMVGQVLTSTAAAASLDLSSRVMACVLRTHADLLTYITWKQEPK